MVKIIFQSGNQEVRRKAMPPECTSAVSWFPGFLIDNMLCWSIQPNKRRIDLSKTYKSPPESR